MFFNVNNLCTVTETPSAWRSRHSRQNIKGELKIIARNCPEIQEQNNTEKPTSLLPVLYLTIS